MKNKEQLRAQIADLVKQYADLSCAPNAFEAGKSVVPPSGKVIGAKEMQQNMVWRHHLTVGLPQGALTMLLKSVCQDFWASSMC